MQVDYDVIIVGSGPAGSAAANVLAGSSLNVLIVDKCKFPREKICGDALTGDSIHNLKYLGLYKEVLQLGLKMGEIELFPLENKSFCLTTEIVTLKREFLDNILFQSALKKNVFYKNLFFTGNCKRENDINLLEFREVDSAKKIFFSCRYVIMAIGCQDTRTFNVLAGEKIMVPDLVAVRGYYRGNFNFDHPLVYFEKALKRGYVWFFPMGDNIFNIGCGQKIGTSSLNLITFLSEFITKIEAQYHVKKGFWERTPKGAMLYSGLKNYRQIKNFVCVGETIGSTYPFTGEGIGKALETGIIAGETILKYIKKSPVSKKSNIEKTYIKCIKKELLPYYRPYFWAEKLFHSPIKNYIYRKICKSTRLQKIITSIITRKTYEYTIRISS